MFKSFLFAIMLLAISPLCAQVSFDNRMEMEIPSDYYIDNIHSLGRDGFVIVNRGQTSTKRLLEWRYDFYNVNLEKEFEKSIYIGDKFRKWGEYKTETHVHQLFKESGGLFDFVSVNLETNELIQVKGDISGKFKLVGLTVLGDYAVCIASDKKVTQLAAINWKTGDSKLIPISIEGFKSNRTHLTHIQVLEESQEFFAYVTAVISKTETESYVVRLNAEGQKQDVFSIETEGGENIASISATKTGAEEYIFTGTYSLDEINQSQGVYFLERKSGKTGFKNFVKFQDLDNFLSYFPGYVGSDVEKKEEKAERKGKQLLLNCNIISHEVVKQGDEYILLGEVYFPTYIIKKHSDGTTSKQFDGYDYNHAFVVKFDKEGSVVWDDGFKINIYSKPRKVTQIISVAEQNDTNMKMVYGSGGSYVFSKSLDYETGEVVDIEESKKIETGTEEEKLKYSQSTIEFWYDNYFLSYGYQVIKNKNSKDKKKRKVFYLAKVGF